MISKNYFEKIVRDYKNIAKTVWFLHRKALDEIKVERIRELKKICSGVVPCAIMGAAIWAVRLISVKEVMPYVYYN